MGHRFVEELNESRVRDLLATFRQGWWTRDRELEDVLEMLRHCDLIIGQVDDASGRMIGCARVPTDHVCKALIFDVIVHAAYRGGSLGVELMDHCRWWGFAEDRGGVLLMRRVNRRAT